jgi:hypothetical protein
VSWIELSEGHTPYPVAVLEICGTVPSVYITTGLVASYNVLTGQGLFFLLTYSQYLRLPKCGDRVLESHTRHVCLSAFLLY